MVLAGISRAPVIGRAFQGIVLFMVAFSSGMLAAQAAELQVQLAIAIRKPVIEMAAAFEKQSGHTVKITVAAPLAIVTTMEGGQHADIVVNTNSALAKLGEKDLVQKGGVPLATTGFGLATRNGDQAPEIGTPDALRTALLAASKIIYNDPVMTPSGQLLLKISDKLGIAEAVKAKSEVVASGASIVTLAKDTSPGTVLALSVLVEVPGHPGAKLVGPLPKELQTPLPYSVALGAHPSDEVAARAFAQMLATADAKKAYAAIGFEIE